CKRYGHGSTHFTSHASSIASAAGRAGPASGTRLKHSHEGASRAAQQKEEVRERRPRRAVGSREPGGRTTGQRTEVRGQMRQGLAVIGYSFSVIRADRLKDQSRR